MSVTGAGASNAPQTVDLHQAEQAQGIVDEPIGPAQAQEYQPIAQRPDGSYDLSALRTLTQADGIPDTVGDAERCSCNSTVAALVAGGKDKLTAGVQGARQEIESRISSSPNPTEARAAWAGQLAKLDTIERDVNGGHLTTGDCNELASVLYQTFSTNKGAGFMLSGDVVRMQHAVGLGATGGEQCPADTASLGQITVNGNQFANPALNANFVQQWQQGAQRLATSTFGGMSAGQNQTVRVFNGQSPPGLPNHFLTIGKDKGGQPFVYDPLGTPNYISGPQAVTYLAGKVPVGVPNGSADPSGGVRGTLRPILPTIAHS